MSSFYFSGIKPANVAEPGRGKAEGSTYFPLLTNPAPHPVLAPDHCTFIPFSSLNLLPVPSPSFHYATAS